MSSDDSSEYEVISYNELVGNKIKDVRYDEYNEEIFFELDNGETWKMYHWQDCCESVYVEDIVGNLQDLIGEVITRFEARSKYSEDEYGDEQWTFYEINTPKTSITIRWCGSSNGYYSTSVSFEMM